jgi:hypothetical protein
MTVGLIFKIHPDFDNKNSDSWEKRGAGRIRPLGTLRAEKSGE